MPTNMAKWFIFAVKIMFTSPLLAICLGATVREFHSHVNRENTTQTHVPEVLVVTSRSLLDCTRKCLERPLCLSVYFRQNADASCHLGNGAAGSGSNVINVDKVAFFNVRQEPPNSVVSPLLPVGSLMPKNTGTTDTTPASMADTTDSTSQSRAETTDTTSPSGEETTDTTSPYGEETTDAVSQSVAETAYIASLPGKEPDTPSSSETKTTDTTSQSRAETTYTTSQSGTETTGTTSLSRVEMSSITSWAETSDTSATRAETNDISASGSATTATTSSSGAQTTDITSTPVASDTLTSQVGSTSIRTEKTQRTSEAETTSSSTQTTTVPSTVQETTTNAVTTTPTSVTTAATVTSTEAPTTTTVKPPACAMLSTGKTLYLHFGPLMWDSAQAVCEGELGRLAVIASKNDHYAVVAALKTSVSATNTLVYINSYRQMNAESVSDWRLFSGQASPFPVWSTGYPISTQEAQCVAMSSSASYFWVHVPCTEKHLFACEK